MGEGSLIGPPHLDFQKQTLNQGQRPEQGPRQGSASSREPPTLVGARVSCHTPSLPLAAFALFLLRFHQERHRNPHDVGNLEQALGRP